MTENEHTRELFTNPKFKEVWESTIKTAVEAEMDKILKQVEAQAETLVKKGVSKTLKGAKKEISSKVDAELEYILEQAEAVVDTKVAEEVDQILQKAAETVSEEAEEAAMLLPKEFACSRCGGRMVEEISSGCVASSNITNLRIADGDLAVGYSEPMLLDINGASYFQCGECGQPVTQEWLEIAAVFKQFPVGTCIWYTNRRERIVEVYDLERNVVLITGLKNERHVLTLRDFVNCVKSGTIRKS